MSNNEIRHLIATHVHCAICPHYWCPKMLAEKLNAQYVHIPNTGDVLEDRTRAAFSELLTLLARHRPVGPDGKHNNLHTATCGCEDK